MPNHRLQIVRNYVDLIIDMNQLWREAQEIDEDQFDMWLYPVKLLEFKVFYSRTDFGVVSVYSCKENGYLLKEFYGQDYYFYHAQI